MTGVATAFDADPGEDLIVWREGALGRIRLNRPKALNAMSYAMMRGIWSALLAWRDDPAVSAVMIDAAGDRAFCAGGDIQQLYAQGPDAPEPSRRYWREEYRLNALIASYPKPYVAAMKGVAMGGGVGISAHGSHRLVTESSRVAMPEAAIGFLPDVGGSWLLARAPGETGRYLGMTGAPMDAADAIFAGFADHFVPETRLEAVAWALAEGRSADAAVLREAEPAPDSRLETRQPAIDAMFSGADALDCLRRVEAEVFDDDADAKAILAALRYNAPVSVAAAFAATTRAKGFERLEEALALEYRFAWRAATSANFFEGVRAAVIDKDRAPNWTPERLEDVTEDMVAAALAPLPPGEEWSVEE